MLKKEIIIPLTANTMVFDVLLFARLEVALEVSVLTDLYWFNDIFSLDCQLSFILELNNISYFLVN